MESDSGLAGRVRRAGALQLSITVRSTLMAEFEIGLLRQRAREAFEQKIQRGHALWELPVGFVRTEEDLVEKIADRQVQEAIASVFRKFREFGSARQTMLWYHDQHIPLPHVRPGTGSTDIVWQTAERESPLPDRQESDLRGCAGVWQDGRQDRG